jgi:cell wall-associated NlpC family hydrolase
LKRAILACTVLVSALSGCASAPHLRGGIPGEKLVATAQKAIGTPYHFGGSSPREGFDCSGLVHWAFAQNGVSVPHSTGQLWHEGSRVKKGELQPGDLLFFDISGSGPSHVGIYEGHNRMVHAPSTGSSVREEDVGIKYWIKRYLGARRLD